MKKLNNKGVTLIELIVSLALISIVMVFIFNLLIDLKAEDSLSSKRSTDALNRSTIIRLIQNDFLDKTINWLKNSLML